MPVADVAPSGRMIAITTKYTDQYLMTQLPGGRWDRDAKHWLAPLAWSTCVALRGLFGADLKVTQALAAWAREVVEERITPALALRDALEVPEGVAVEHMAALDAVEQGSTLKLFPYQRADVAYLATNGCALLCNEPGLGKTGSTIRTLQVLAHEKRDPFPAVVICPNSLKRSVWAKELAMWAPELAVRIVTGNVAQRRKALAPGADVYVVHWEGTRLHSRLAAYGDTELSDAEKTPKEINVLDPHTVVLDEAHRAKDPHAKQTRAAWAVGTDARFRFLLTGTPTGNHVGDAWSLLRTTEPEWFPAKTKWAERYVDTVSGFYGGTTVLGLKPSTRDELFKVVNPIMRRVPKEAALPQLPPKLPVQIRETPMSPKQRKAYFQMRDAMVAELNDLIIAPNPLSKLTRLLQFASSYAEVDLETEKLRLIAPSNKVDDLLDLLDDLGDEPLVVGAVSRQLIDLAATALQERNISHVLVTGAQSSDERAKSVDRFQGGHARVILCTLGAGAEGLTLTKASHLLFMQESWSMIQNRQFEDRVHRIGAEGHAAISIYKQITPETVEENRLAVMAGKEGQMQQLVRDAETLKKLLGIA